MQALLLAALAQVSQPVSTVPISNDPPLAPVITEPFSGQICNPADVHMEVAGFVDPDPRDAHLCSDWEIWDVSPPERVWSAHCIGGLAAVHAHLGDGVFEGSLAGAGTLAELGDYVLQTRHRDSSGDPASEWSPWSTRAFKTGLAQAWFPLELEDVASLPGPLWRSAESGAPIDLPLGASLRIETGQGALLAELHGQNGADLWVNPPELTEHAPVRVRLFGGTQELALPASDLLLFEHGCEPHKLLLPAVQLAPGLDEYCWITSEGIAFLGFAWQTDPIFTGAPLRLPDPPWTSEQLGFVVENVATGFQLPVDIAFVPAPGPAPDDVLFYVSELYGAIRTVARDGTVGTYASGLLDYVPTGAFPGSGEQGLSCLAVEPASGDVFAAMLYDGGGPHYPKVVRFTSADGGRTAASSAVVLDFPGESQGQSHQISNLAILPDRTLIVHMGDGFTASTAQNPLSYRGKILRANLDGSAPADNPFYDPLDGFDARDYTFALGVRNPFGGDWREADGHLYEVENGPSTDRFVRLTPGMNVGWDGTNPSMFLNAIHVWSPAKAPVSLAFAQSSSFGGGGFPAVKQGHAFVSLSGATYASGPQNGAKRIVELTLDAAGAVIGGPLPLVRYVGSGKSSISGMAFGPDGLYFATLYPDSASAGATAAGASVLRVRFDTGADCNGNGEVDPCDIAAGVSADCNGDLVPDECQKAEELVRAGTPPNPTALKPGVTTPPALGKTWDPAVDHNGFEPAAVLDVLAVSGLPANVPLPFGTLLCDLSTPPLLLAAVPGHAFHVLIPPDCVNLGRRASAQAASVRADGSVALTNALDVTVGL